MKISPMQVTLIDHMGSDLSVVNAARVSFDKESKWESGYSEADGEYFHLSERDEKLIKYLANHAHWTPFAHCTATVRVKAPFFIARQLFKHKQGFNENEISRRYVDSAPEFYSLRWRWAVENKKQGSGDNVDEGTQQIADNLMEALIEHSVDTYNNLLKLNICAEQARAALLLDAMTEWYWTGSLYAFARACKQRLGHGAQAEAGVVAELISAEMSKLYPCSWKSLLEV